MTTTDRIDVSALASSLTGADGLIDQRDGHIALALYRLLAEGKPVPIRRLAARAARTHAEVTAWLRGARTVRLDDDHNVVAFQGLDLRPTRHVLDVAGRTLHAWCAADALGVPQLLDQPVTVRSTDPITDEPLSFTLDGTQLRDPEPSTITVSVIRPGGVPELVANDDSPLDERIMAVCGPINFFRSAASGQTFTDHVTHTVQLTLADGVELLHHINQTVLGAALNAPDRSTVTTLRKAWSKRDFSTTEEIKTAIRLLADGKPVTPHALADATGHTVDDARGLIDTARQRGVEVENGDVIGAALTRRPTQHRFRVRGHDLHTWCGFDALFLPLILDERAEVASTCPETGTAIHLALEADGAATHVTPAGVVVAVVGNDILSCCPTAGPASDICTQMPFFASREAGERWATDHPGAAILDLNDARSIARSYIDGPVEETHGGATGRDS